MATFPEITNWLEADDSLHLGRLLILLSVFAGRKGNQPIEGLTKLAKLDFLLRYPAYLERGLIARGAGEAAVQVEEFERNSVEAHMVRYRFGPWDHRYRRFLNVLVGRGLAVFRQEGRTNMIYITERGSAAAQELLAQSEFNSIRARAALLKRYFDLTGTSLMNFIYNTFPEVVSLRSGEMID